MFSRCVILSSVASADIFTPLIISATGSILVALMTLWFILLAEDLFYRLSSRYVNEYETTHF